MSIQRFLTAAAVAFAVCLPATAFGATVVNLYDHPDGNKTPDDQSPPNYGLRLDGLISGGTNPNLAEFFSFETGSNAANIPANSLAQLGWDFTANGGDGIAVLAGQMRRNSDDSLWNLAVSMTGLTSLSNGWSADAFRGSLTAVADGEVIDLPGKDDDYGKSFTFATAVGNNLDFRDGIPTAAGWIDGFPDGTTNDFLATAGAPEFGGELPDIPLPAGVFLLMGGLGALGATRLKRKRG